ncbi:hypothetical protein [Conexibacter sp. CPCC 206217]|uniref:hypothetical protein n=1 Tax=Conexibacter sp. CPCC 206217 TaxID=3064574 RepID=UPI002728789E|nr:hypothetical protein [Conexibacter sp. CPCC 206217]MDO8213622.1 hypothetical protein [Conexibacter sp. CPCC 206217]
MSRTGIVPTVAPGAATAPGTASGQAGDAATARPAVDRCPGILRLHDAGDGGLARVRVPGGRLSRRTLTTLADATRLGNGLAELTSRASVQVRGLPADAAAPLVALLAAGELLPSRAHDRVRNVLASPLAGRVPGALGAAHGSLGDFTAASAHGSLGDVAAASAHGSLLPTDALVAQLDAALCADPALAALPGRFLFALDDGAGFVDVAASDVALVAEPIARVPGRSAGADPRDAGGGDRAAGATAGARFRLHLAAIPTTLTVEPGDAVPLLLRTALTFLTLRAELAPTAWHVADLPDGAAALAAALTTALAHASSGRSLVQETSDRPLLAPGALIQADGRVAITALPPLARLDTRQLDGLSELLVAHGLDDARLSTARTITVPDIEADRADAVAAGLRALGLVTTPDSGWRGLTACSGAGACRRALVDVRAAAAVRATQRGPQAPAEHWSACPRRCGMKRDVAVGIVAGDDTLLMTRAGVARGEATDVEHALELLTTTDERPAA